MKNKSLKGILALGILMLMQTGCNPQGNTTERSNQVIVLEKRAQLLENEGRIDSAIAYYRKSLTLCCFLEKQTDSTKDTVYNRKIASLYNDIGHIYSLNNFDSAFPYLFKSLKWAKASNMPTLILTDEGLIGLQYYKAGTKYDQGSSGRKKIYSNGIQYVLAVFRDIDSLRLPENTVKFKKMKLGGYDLLQAMYKGLDDTINAAFYRNKYKELKAQLNTETNQ